MSRSTGLRAKIGIAFILQAAAVSCGAILGVYAAAAVLQDVLIKRALKEESGHYLALLRERPDLPEPNTYNMRGYLLRPGQTQDSLPTDLRALGPGFHTLRRDEGKPLAYVTDSESGRLYLMFDQEQVGRLAVWFGMVPLALVLILVYFATWLTYRLSKRAISPVIWLATTVRSLDPRKPDLSALSLEQMPPDVEGETEVLAEALRGFAERQTELIERERNFTRDASHELRSPLTVIKIASEVLASDGELDDFESRNVERIRRASRDMEALIEAFLILARDSASGLPSEDFLLETVAREEVERAEALLVGKPVVLRLQQHGSCLMHAPPKVVGVIIGNLIRNACAYTERGEVNVRLRCGEVTIRDTGPGIDQEELGRIFQPFYRAAGASPGGHGVGLNIVRRLCDRFGWQVKLESEVGRGTLATIRFPDARPAQLHEHPGDQAANTESAETVG
ncbi:MAG: HAMP domain-containing histidine kinase [Xanthomonadales bacterium]|nr:HAMP domain-containing histidine kinase [Xanthomonadales bacterium]